MKQIFFLLALIVLALTPRNSHAQRPCPTDSVRHVQLAQARATRDSSSANPLKLTTEQRRLMADIRRNWTREWGETARRVKEARRERKRRLDAVLTDEQRALRDQLRASKTPGIAPAEENE